MSSFLRATSNVLSVFVLASVTGCGGIVRFSEDTSLDCADVSFDFDVPIEVCAIGGVTPEAGPGTCSIFGALPDGRGGEIRCTSVDDRCDLFLEGELTCSCAADQIDLANTCPNGVPTCSAWMVSFADARECTS